MGPRAGGPATPAGSLTPQRQSRRLQREGVVAVSFGAISQSPFVAAASLPRSPAAMRPASRASPRSPRLSATGASRALRSARSLPRACARARASDRSQAGAGAGAPRARRARRAAAPTPAAPARPTPKPAADPAMPPTSVVKAKAPAWWTRERAESTGPRPLVGAEQVQGDGSEGHREGVRAPQVSRREVRRHRREKRQAALNAVPALVADAAAAGGLRRPRAAVEGLAIQLDDLRSAIVRAACEALTAVAAAHGGGAAPLLALVLPQLFRNLYVTKRRSRSRSATPPSRSCARCRQAALRRPRPGTRTLRRAAAPPPTCAAAGDRRRPRRGLDVEGISLGAALVALIATGMRACAPSAPRRTGACTRWAGPAEGLLSKLEPAQQKLVKGNAPK